MKLSHRMLTVAVLLVGALMTVSEAPEILTLTDDASNDYLSISIGRVSPRTSIVKDATDRAISPHVLFGVPSGERDVAAHSFLLSRSSKSPRSLLLLLVTQRN
jgi:hypothetical protein